VVKNGGRVMKNVTGYDLVKLMAGSYGTLGVLTELAFKVLPAPETVATVLIEGLDDAAAIAAMTGALSSPYDVSGAAHFPVGMDGAPVTMIRIEGFARSVAYRAEKLRGLLGGTVETDADRIAAGWKRVRDAEALANRPGAVWRVSVKPSDGPAVVAAIRHDFAFYDWGGGLVWLLVPETGDASAAEIRAVTRRLGGHATLIRAAAATRASVAVFEPEPAPLAAISAGLRAKFDPRGMLNPGRMGG
jgi:glycolate oxidase FAD binding subunit